MTNIFQRVSLFCSISIHLTYCLQSRAQHIPFAGNRSVTWEECIDQYRNLDENFEDAKLIECGSTDVGKPLHLFILNRDRIFYPELFDRSKTVILINNGIHPGEPDGVDASIIFARELLTDKNLQSLLDSVIFCIVPIYNVDGALKRGKHSRANQNGPEEYGFRGNARNLDLNRDFIKCDSENAKSFTALFQKVKPHLFVDTHVSNGADYPYTMTLITTQTDKLGVRLGNFVRQEIEPALFAAMKSVGYEMCPYVHTMGRTPQSGLLDFLETPRFASGYAALFNTIGFITETHMLKPFSARVESTYAFLLQLAKYADEHSDSIVAMKKLADNDILHQKKLPFNFELDTTTKSTIQFQGYDAKFTASDVGTGNRLTYDHNAPWTKQIPLYRKFQPKMEIEIPEAYIVPQAWTEVIERLKCNDVSMKRLEKDTILRCGTYYIEEYETENAPYEGHYLHSEIKVSYFEKEIAFYAGDYFISTNQTTRRYLCEVLEPQSPDGFFAWNFFDSILQQKEWFSDYVFEDIAAELLKTDLELKKEFEKAMMTNPELKENHWNQLYWIYKHSPYFEDSMNRYPVVRIDKVKEAK